MEAPAINGNHVIEESEVEKPPEVEIETLALEEKPTNEISLETNGPTNEIPIETNGISEDPKVWQYWLSGGTNFFKDKSPEVPFHGITSSYSYFEEFEFFCQFSKKQNMIKKKYQLNRYENFVDKTL